MKRFFPLLFGACLIAASGASAQDSLEDRLRTALREAQSRAGALQSQINQLSAQNQQLTREKTDLEGKAAAETARADAIREKAEAAQKELDTVRGAGQAALAQAQALQASDQALRARIDEWQKAYDDLRGKAEQVVAERDQILAKAREINAESASTKNELAACTTKNQKLYEIGNELIDRYKNKGVFEALSDNEPFLQLSRVELEKTSQDYGDKIYDNKVGVASPDTVGVPDQSPSKNPAK